jgi:hypothetical protein
VRRIDLEHRLEERGRELGSQEVLLLDAGQVEQALDPRDVVGRLVDERRQRILHFLPPLRLGGLHLEGRHDGGIRGVGTERLEQGVQGLPMVFEAVPERLGHAAKEPAALAGTLGALQLPQIQLDQLDPKTLLSIPCLEKIGRDGGGWNGRRRRSGRGAHARRGRRGRARGRAR